MVKIDSVVAIDPDVDKSGVAIVGKDKKVEAYCLDLPDLIRFLINKRDKGDKFRVIVEASFKISHNWSANKKLSKAAISSIGVRIGRNHQIAHDVIAFCKTLDIDCVPMRPLVKHWRGSNGKISHKEITRFMDIKGRTNQEKRDALLLGWVYLNHPIRVYNY